MKEKNQSILPNNNAPKIEKGSFVEVEGLKYHEYMIIRQKGNFTFSALPVVEENETDTGCYQRAYANKVVLLNECADFSYNRIVSVKPRIAKHLVMSIIQKRTEYKKGLHHQSEVNFIRKEDGLYSGNPWDGLASITTSPKIYKG